MHKSQLHLTRVLGHRIRDSVDGACSPARRTPANRWSACSGDRQVQIRPWDGLQSVPQLLDAGSISIRRSPELCQIRGHRLPPKCAVHTQCCCPTPIRRPTAVRNHESSKDCRTLTTCFSRGTKWDSVVTFQDVCVPPHSRLCPRTVQPAHAGPECPSCVVVPLSVQETVAGGCVPTTVLGRYCRAGHRCHTGSIRAIGAILCHSRRAC